MLGQLARESNTHKSSIDSFRRSSIEGEHATERSGTGLRTPLDFWPWEERARTRNRPKNGLLLGLILLLVAQNVFLGDRSLADLVHGFFQPTEWAASIVIDLAENDQPSGRTC